MLNESRITYWAYLCRHHHHDEQEDVHQDRVVATKRIMMNWIITNRMNHESWIWRGDRVTFLQYSGTCNFKYKFSCKYEFSTCADDIMKIMKIIKKRESQHRCAGDHTNLETNENCWTCALETMQISTKRELQHLRTCDRANLEKNENCIQKSRTVPYWTEVFADTKYGLRR